MAKATRRIQRELQLPAYPSPSKTVESSGRLFARCYPRLVESRIPPPSNGHFKHKLMLDGAMSQQTQRFFLAQDGVTRTDDTRCHNF